MRTGNDHSAGFFTGGMAEMSLYAQQKTPQPINQAAVRSQDEELERIDGGN
jgi:hypothetical protein